MPPVPERPFSRFARSRIRKRPNPSPPVHDVTSTLVAETIPLPTILAPPAPKSSAPPGENSAQTAEIRHDDIARTHRPPPPPSNVPPTPGGAAPHTEGHAALRMRIETQEEEYQTASHPYLLATQFAPQPIGVATPAKAKSRAHASQAHHPDRLPASDQPDRLPPSPVSFSIQCKLQLKGKLPISGASSHRSPPAERAYAPVHAQRTHRQKHPASHQTSSPAPCRIRCKLQLRDKQPVSYANDRRPLQPRRFSEPVQARLADVRRPSGQSAPSSARRTNCPAPVPHPTSQQSMPRARVPEAGLAPAPFPPVPPSRFLWPFATAIPSGLRSKQVLMRVPEQGLEPAHEHELLSQPHGEQRKQPPQDPEDGQTQEQRREHDCEQEARLDAEMEDQLKPEGARDQEQDPELEEEREEEEEQEPEQASESELESDAGVQQQQDYGPPFYDREKHALPQVLHSSPLRPSRMSPIREGDREAVPTSPTRPHHATLSFSDDLRILTAWRQLARRYNPFSSRVFARAVTEAANATGSGTVLLAPIVECRMLVLRKYFDYVLNLSVQGRISQGQEGDHFSFFHQMQDILLESRQARRAFVKAQATNTRENVHHRNGTLKVLLGGVPIADVPMHPADFSLLQDVRRRTPKTCSSLPREIARSLSPSPTTGVHAVSVQYQTAQQAEECLAVGNDDSDLEQEQRRAWLRGAWNGPIWDRNLVCRNASTRTSDGGLMMMPGDPPEFNRATGPLWEAADDHSYGHARLEQCEGSEMVADEGTSTMKEVMTAVKYGSSKNDVMNTMPVETEDVVQEDNLVAEMTRTSRYVEDGADHGEKCQLERMDRLSDQVDDVLDERDAQKNTAAAAENIAQGAACRRYVEAEEMKVATFQEGDVGEDADLHADVGSRESDVSFFQAGERKFAVFPPKQNGSSVSGLQFEEHELANEQRVALNLSYHEPQRLNSYGHHRRRIGTEDNEQDAVDNGEGIRDGDDEGIRDGELNETQLRYTREGQARDGAVHEGHKSHGFGSTFDEREVPDDYEAIDGIHQESAEGAVLKPFHDRNCDDSVGNRKNSDVAMGRSDSLAAPDGSAIWKRKRRADCEKVLVRSKALAPAPSSDEIAVKDPDKRRRVARGLEITSNVGVAQAQPITQDEQETESPDIKGEVFDGGGSSLNDEETDPVGCDETGLENPPVLTSLQNRVPRRIPVLVALQIRNTQPKASALGRKREDTPEFEMSQDEESVEAASSSGVGRTAPLAQIRRSSSVALNEGAARQTESVRQNDAQKTDLQKQEDEQQRLRKKRLTEELHSLALTLETVGKPFSASRYRKRMQRLAGSR